MKILHVASFSGNIGDNASHLGFSRILNQLGIHAQIERLEIRRFYKSYNEADKCFFDEVFVNYANSFDLLVIGGGGFLDYWVPNSATGTTIDIELPLLEKLSVKTLISSVGCMPHKDVPDGNIEKFRAFLDACIAKDNIHISLRNDGSINTIKNIVGAQYLPHLPEILDNGFFYDVQAQEPFPSGRYITLNITEDQIRMNSEFRGAIDEDLYYKEMKKLVTSIVNDYRTNLVLVPHIYSDLRAINHLQSLLPDKFMRNNVFVAPCVQGDMGTNHIYSIYKNSDLVLATRLHANVCNLAMGKPVVGLIALDRVKYIYENLDAAEQAQPLSGNFAENVINCMDSTLKNATSITKKVVSNCQIARKKSLAIYGDILKDFTHA